MKSSMVLVLRRARGRGRGEGEGEGWRRGVDCGELVSECGFMVMEGFLGGGWVERAEEEGRAWRAVAADISGEEASWEN